MLTFLEGAPLHQAPRSAGQMRALGEALGVVARALSDFRPEVPQQDLLWDLCKAGSLRELTPFVGAERRSAAERALDAFELMAQGPMRALPRQVIHNDFNPHNVLVGADDPERIAGVIDFGDMVEAPRINDLAVALSYQVALGAGFDLAVTALAAYCRVFPLTSEEIACLPTLLRMRLAMTILITEWRSKLHPENRAYILRNHALANAGLVKLANFSDAALAAHFQASLETLA